MDDMNEACSQKLKEYSNTMNSEKEKHSYIYKI